MYVGKLIIKAAWRTYRFDTCAASVYRNNPVPLAVEHDSAVLAEMEIISRKNSFDCVIAYF